MQFGAKNRNFFFLKKFKKKHNTSVFFLKKIRVPKLRRQILRHLLSIFLRKKKCQELPETQIKQYTYEKWNNRLNNRWSCCWLKIENKIEFYFVSFQINFFSYLFCLEKLLTLIKWSVLFFLRLLIVHAGVRFLGQGLYSLWEELMRSWEKILVESWDICLVLL